VTTPQSTEVSHTKRDPGSPDAAPTPTGLAALGGWLFKRRTSIPVPIVLALLVVPAGDASDPRALVAAGASLVLAGELLRFWAVRHIGAISRTRADRLGPLVAGGPFRLVRNPLYIGNLLIWAGFALAAQLVWMVPAILLLIGFEYHAIVRWEEQLLLARRGDEYRAYLRRVPRWLPTLAPPRDFPMRPAAYTWAQALYSERGTIIAIAAGALLLILKARVLPPGLS
jgi:protein-S-isoprenylcysteine O-methyltransferase Ste14